ncbi:MAG: hypothetical protein MJZ37_00770 [Bacilli bacterium]|nr:hypothetical protein [Bacilli bacterium]
MAKSGRPKTTSTNVSTEPEVKTTGPVESPIVETKPEEPKRYLFGEKTFTVVNKEMAGRKISASSGAIITFDENGKAKVGMKDAEHLSRIPGYSVSEK